MKQQEPVIIVDDPHAPHRLERKGPLILMPENSPRLLEAVAHQAAVAEQLRREDALDVLRKAADDPNADPREPVGTNDESGPLPRTERGAESKAASPDAAPGDAQG